jgi:hypothetical protein
MKKHKVEGKGSWFQVTLESGCYSDWNIMFYVFAGNSIEEVWELVKIWAKDGGIDSEDFDQIGLIYNDERFQFGDLPDYEKDREIRWDTEYGDAFLVQIKRLNVIYVNY